MELVEGRFLGVTNYFYPRPNGCGCVSKYVFFFEMDATEGTVTLEDTFDDAEWLPPAQAAERLSWDNEAEIVRRATDWG